MEKNQNIEKETIIRKKETKYKKGLKIMTKRFQPFNENFFKTGAYKIIWFDKKGLVELDENRNAEITLVTDRVSEQYEGYLVSVNHKQNGEITRHYFPFNHYMKERSDDRQKGSKHAHEGKFYVWGSSSEDQPTWYISIPTNHEIEKMTEAIDTFIAMYQ